MAFNISTKECIRTILAADTSATAAEREAVLLALDGQLKPADGGGAPKLPEILSIDEVARLLGGISRMTVFRLAREGKIRRAYLSDGRQRARGYHADSVRAFIEGRC